jgi:hypothetical protein
MSKSKLEYSLHVAINGEIAAALNRAATLSMETPSQITRRALVRELRSAGVLPDPNSSPQMGAAA